MHEISVMTQVIDAVRRIAMETGATRVLSVRLQVGELTFLATEQLGFAFEILTRGEVELMEGTQLCMETLDARGMCKGCGFMGALEVVELPDSHFATPTLSCPGCGERLEVTEGRDLIIRDIQLELPEDADGDGRIEVVPSPAVGGDGDG